MHTLLFDLADHVETIVVGAVLALAFGIYAWTRGWPQRTIAALTDVTQADEKAIERSQRERKAVEHERDGYMADVERLLREAKIHIDIQEKDSATIAALSTRVNDQEETIIILRKELNQTLQDLENCRKNRERG